MIMKVIIMLLCIIRKGEKRNLYFHIAYVGRHGNIDMWKNKKKRTRLTQTTMSIYYYQCAGPNQIVLDNHIFYSSID